MKRDFFLIRKMLMAVEEAPPGAVIQNFPYDDTDARTITEHVKLLKEGGFLDADIISQLGSSDSFYIVTRLTWKGHEFLDNLKNDTLWKKLMARAQEKGISIS